ncbi:hypothetical protein ONZ45_g12126 [Pleurotus djamor]|nr:hypothetical protein ONZ45_g12126 [Pleurotus djamor]
MAVSVSHIVLGLFVFFALRHKFSKKTKLPPGPPGLPFVGSALSMPREKEWITYDRWRKLYGRMTYVNVFGQNIIFLNDANTANELLGKRNAISAERPRFPMLEMMGFKDWNIGILSKGPVFSHGRKVLNQSFGLSSMYKFQALQTREVSSLLVRLKESPEDFEKHLRRVHVGQIMQVFLGHEIDRDDSRGFVQLNKDMVDATSAPGSVGAFLLNVFPNASYKPLTYWPVWLPGGGFQRVVKKALSLCNTFLDVVDNESHPPESFYQINMSAARTNEEKLGVRAAVVTSYSAGAETSTAVLLTAFLAMILFPEVQRKAHQELDQVLQGRLPTLDDRSGNKLPYITAILLECLRWAPPGSFGLPHLMTADSVVDEYTIPSGTIVMSNIWSILHDQNVYDSPGEFTPERFLGPQAEADPRVHSFGYGKRVCPGRHLAESLLWLSLASILTVFDILPAVDESGSPQLPTVDFTSGVMSRPLPFRCQIVPRSKDSLSLIHG